MMKPSENDSAFLFDEAEDPKKDYECRMVKLVRCKDCVYYNKHLICERMKHDINDDGFCSWGERKEQE